MAGKKLIGNKAFLFFDTLEPQKFISGTGANSTAADTWYYVVERGVPSGIPAGFTAGMLFRSPVQGTQLVLLAGDRVMPINPQRFCDASGEFTDSAMELVDRYFNVAEDNGAGVYAITPRTGDPRDSMTLLIDLNSETKDGRAEKWLFTVLPMNVYCTGPGPGEAGRGQAERRA